MESALLFVSSAMISNNFQYTSNAWELEKIPAANPFYSDLSFMQYEVKQTNIDDKKKKKVIELQMSFIFKNFLLEQLDFVLISKIKMQ